MRKNNWPDLIRAGDQAAIKLVAIPTYGVERPLAPLLLLPAAPRLRADSFYK